MEFDLKTHKPTTKIALEKAITTWCCDRGFLDC